MEINRGVVSGLAEKQNRSIISRISGTIKNWLIINFRLLQNHLSIFDRLIT